MATITPLTGQIANTTQNQRVDLPETDNMPKSRSTETVIPERNAVEAVQKSEQIEPTPVGREEKSQNTPESGSTFIATV